VFRYVRAATKADDALHAFTFAYVVAKIFMGEPIVHDPALEEKVRRVLSASSPVARASIAAEDIFGVPNFIVSG
jgi:Flp pilus assembly protein CpaB